MNYPSVKTIQSILGVDPSKAKLIRGVMDNSISPFNEELFPKTAQVFSRNYHPPSKHEAKLEALNEILEGYGVEVVGDVNNYPPRIDVEYVNMGDTYTATVLFHQGRYKVGSWGDIVEKFNL